jgi:hypothetical protein
MNEAILQLREVIANAYTSLTSVQELTKMTFNPKINDNYINKHWDGASLDDLAYEMDALKNLKEINESIEGIINKWYDELRLVKIPNAMEDAGISNIKYGFGRITASGDLYVSIVSGQSEAVFEFLDDLGKGDLVKPTVNPSTLKAVVKELIKSGEEIPGDILKVTPFTRVSITKA